MICGKVLQDRNLPDALRDKDADESIALSESLLEKWHGRGRQLYAVIPRFAPTSTLGNCNLPENYTAGMPTRGIYAHSP